MPALRKFSFAFRSTRFHLNKIVSCSNYQLNCQIDRLICVSCILDAPQLESEQGNVKYAFISREPVSWFEIRVRSFPTPAAFVWPDSFQAQLASVTDDVTHYRVSIDTADYTELATFDVTGRNGENGPLFSTIQIRVELERE